MSKIFFISIFTLLSINSVFAISVISSPTYQANCPGAVVNDTIYITGSTLKIYPTDLMRSVSKLLFVRNGESSVSIWQNTANTLTSGCSQPLDASNTGWGRLSNVVQGDGQYVGIFKVFGNICDANKVKRTNTTLPSVQFAYNIAYKEELSVASGINSYFYYPYTSFLSSVQTFIPDQTTRNWGPLLNHPLECHNFTFTYCGDGVLDTTHGETCDDGNNIDGDGCSAICQTETLPTCNSLTATPNSGNSPLTSTFTCNATSATGYLIQIFSGTTVLNTINTNTGTYTFANTGNYTARCTINGNITSAACLIPITVSSPVPSITIDKRDANPTDLDLVVGNDTQTVNIGSGAIFRIRATNNFTESLRNIVLTDAVAPNCAGSVTLPGTFPSTWTNVTVGGLGDHTNAILEVGEYIDYVCSRNNTTVGYTNSATVTGIGITSGQSVTSTDTTVVLVPGAGGPNCGTAGGYRFSSSDTTWGALTFCSSGAIPNPNPPAFPGVGGSTSWTCNGSGSTVPCNASRGGGGGSQPDCIRIEVSDTGSTANKTFLAGTNVGITCIGSANTEVVKLDCGNGSVSTQNTTAIGKFNCIYNSVGTYNPICYVGNGATSGIPNITTYTCNTKVTVPGGGGGGGGGGGTKGFCGDGVLQRPNDDGLMEECEKALVGGVLRFPDWCINCKTTNLTIPGEGGAILTYPGNGNIFFKPFGQIILGAGVNPFTAFGTFPYLGNNSSEDIYLDYPLCVHNSNSSVILRSDNSGLSKVCTAKNIGWMYPGVTKTYESLNYGNTINIKTVKITGSESYKDTVIKTTIGDFKDSFFTAVLKIRVSKPAIATVGGGTSLIKNGNVTADINKVAGNGYSDPNKNKNFVGAGVSTGSISSYSTKVVSNNSVTKISSGQTQKVESNLTKVTTTATSGNKNIGDVLTKYNGLSNVYIVKNGDLTINSSILGSGERTYIIEGGNLYINQNITYADNIAFVVKGGNIIIASNVTKINGTFISIKNGLVGGKIISTESNDKLVINGSLYGNIESLVNNRTYIENKNNLINVGTVVSFGSNLFRKQAPLVGDFIGEYVKSTKVAQ